MDASATAASPPYILVVEDDRGVANMLQTTLQLEGYEASIARNGKDGLDAALRDMPELILLDLMLPDMDGMNVLSQLRTNPKSEHIPVIILSGRHDIDVKVRAFKFQVDDYLTKPFSADELMARIRARLQRRNMRVNHLTGLPAGGRIEQAISRQLQSAEPWALLYFDLDNFKAFNDTYGPFNGDELIKLMGRIATDIMRERGETVDFLGHIGGDDFVIVTAPARIAPLCDSLIERWESESRTFYPEDVQARGTFYGKDRSGVHRFLPLVAVSIAVVTNQHRPIRTIDEVSLIAAEVKAKAKSLPGSAYYIDQRAARRDTAGSDATSGATSAHPAAS